MATAYVFCVIFALIGAPVTAYHILGVFPTMATSHYKLGHSLMKGLAMAGHNVTVISPYPLNRPIPNYRSIVVKGTNQFWAGKNISIFAS